jgi:transcription initiation factor TFIIIB Brf1 subunit/transcription initiation factor TFIIB
MILNCPKCEEPLVVERPESLERDEQLAGCKCAACGVVLSDEEIGQAIKSALDVLFGK